MSLNLQIGCLNLTDYGCLVSIWTVTCSAFHLVKRINITNAYQHYTRIKFNCFCTVNKLVFSVCSKMCTWLNRKWLQFKLQTEKNLPFITEILHKYPTPIIIDICMHRKLRYLGPKQPQIPSKILTNKKAKTSERYSGY